MTNEMRINQYSNIRLKSWLDWIINAKDNQAENRKDDIIIKLHKLGYSKKLTPTNSQKNRITKNTIQLLKKNIGEEDFREKFIEEM
jgi:hypothetical protein